MSSQSDDDLEEDRPELIDKSFQVCEADFPVDYRRSSRLAEKRKRDLSDADERPSIKRKKRGYLS
jgi:hypothetical protein